MHSGSLSGGTGDDACGGSGSSDENGEVNVVNAGRGGADGGAAACSNLVINGSETAAPETAKQERV